MQEVLAGDLNEVTLYQYDNSSNIPYSRTGEDRFVKNGYHPLDHARQLAAEGKNLSALVLYPHDWRNEIGPFALISSRMFFAAPCEVGGLLHESGFTVRIVQESMNPRIKVNKAKLNNKSVDLLAISMMQIHRAAADRHMRQAHRLGEQRPLIVCGGPDVIYDWPHLFDGPKDAQPDFGVTGEAYILLEVLSLIEEYQKPNETLRQAFTRIKQEQKAALCNIPGLVFLDSSNPKQIIFTGTPRLLRKLEHRPSILTGLALYEPSSRFRSGLSKEPLNLSEIHKHMSILAMPGFTTGCPEICEFCPIPDRFQGTYRFTDPEYIKNELVEIVSKTGIRNFFFGDDSLASQSNYMEELWSCLSEVNVGDKKLGEIIWIGTEAILADIANLLKQGEKTKNILAKAFAGGLKALWFGIEELDPQHVNKGQGHVNIDVVFASLKEIGIQPMSMTIMFGDQTWNDQQKTGLSIIQTIDRLEKAGSVSYQNLSIVPSIGSPAWKGLFERGEVLSRVGKYRIEPLWFSGNQVIMGEVHVDEFGDHLPIHNETLWKAQLRMLMSYWYFYRPSKILDQLFRCMVTKEEIEWRTLQWQCYGLIQVIVTTAHILPWLYQLWRGPWERVRGIPELKHQLVTVSNVLNIRKRLKVSPHARAASNVK